MIQHFTIPFLQKPLKPLLLAILGLLPLTGRSQSKISLHYKDQRLDTIFNAIAKQANLNFICDGRNVAAIRIPRILLVNVGLEEAVQKALKGLPVTYEFIENSIVLRLNETAAAPVVPHTIRCTIVGEEKQPVAGASVELLNAAWAVNTNGNGHFVLQGVAADEVLRISSQNYSQLHIAVSMLTDTIVLKPLYKPLNEVVVTSLGKYARKETVSWEQSFAASEVFAPGDQNILQGLNGKVAGLSFQLNSGDPHASPNADIRGGKTLDKLVSSSYPMLVIDGVPFDPGIAPLNLLFSPAGGGDNNKGMSVLNIINPMDIDSVTVLKGPAAAALYGSRGANGVIEYFTRKGRTEKPSLSINLLTGFRQVTHLMPMLSKQQYLDARAEAFRNDGIPITPQNAPDLKTWDPNRYTDFGKRYTGNNAGLINLQLNYTGSFRKTSFYFGAALRKDGSVSGLGLGNRQGSLRLNLNHTSPSGNISWLFNNYLSGEVLNTTQYDLTRYIILPPNFPLYNSSGQLYFTSFNRLPNPDAMSMKRYEFATSYGSSNLRLNVKLMPRLELHSTISLSRLLIRENSTNPAASNAPQSNPMGEAAFAGTAMNTVFLQSYASYEITLGGFNATLMAGSSWQQRNTTTSTRYGYEYNSDDHLNIPDSAGRLDKLPPVHSRYRYGALFTSGVFSFRKKYLFQYTGRADASSRIGPNKQLALFPSVSAGWILSQETWVKKQLHYLSFLKISIAAGRSGNDMIGERRFDGYWVEDGTMDGMIIYQPQTPFNPDFGWERKEDIELTLEMGLLKDRLRIITSASRNRSSNLLMRTRLSDQTGFRNMVSNVDVALENRSLEFTITYRCEKKRKFNWEMSFNLTIPDNRLLKLPPEVAAEYPGMFEVGRSIQSYSAYKWLGVDPGNGNGRFADEDKDGQFPSAGDLRFRGNLDPRFYGGCRTALSWKNLSLDLDFYFRAQTGRNYLWYTGNLVAGRANNLPQYEWDRWQQPGNYSSTMKFTTTTAGAIADATRWKANSTAAYSNASYLRCTALRLGYNCNTKRMKITGIQSVRFYLNAANLFTITGFRGHDPETQGAFSLPPLRQVTAGIELRL